MKQKKSDKVGIPKWLCEVVKDTCKILLEKGSLEELTKYTKDIKLPVDFCNNCNSNTATIECEEYKLCAQCLKSKKNELF